MKNWLGQEIKLDDVVYRGAREGNMSAFKIGVIVYDGPDRVRVHWHVEDGYLFDDVHRTRYCVPQIVDSVGSYKSVESLLVIDPGILVHAKLWGEEVRKYRETKDPHIKQAIIDQFS